MQIQHWITIGSGCIGLVGLLWAIYLARKKGDIKKIAIYFTPSKLKRRSPNKFFVIKGKTIPSIGVINFLSLPKSNHKRVCLHIYLTIENLSKYAVEDAAIHLTYPRKYFDENDNHFFEPSGKGSKRELEYTLIDDDTIQVTYNYPLLHPKNKYQIIHPIILSIKDCYQEVDLNNPLYFDISGKGFSFDLFGYKISAKNLSKPVSGTFWVINTIDLPYKTFFLREKKFLNAITKNFKHDRFIFEHRTISISDYKEGKFKKDVIVVPTQKLNVSYCHFPRLKEPNSRTFNFEESKDDKYE